MVKDERRKMSIVDSMNERPLKLRETRVGRKGSTRIV